MATAPGIQATTTLNHIEKVSFLGRIFFLSENSNGHIFYDRTKTQLSAMLRGNSYFVIHPYEKENEIYTILNEIL